LFGLSGGVDSAVSAALLLERGLHVEGLTIKVPGAKPNGAADVAKKLGIKLTEVDVSEAFTRYVAAPFKAEYAAGRTPNPCILCNPNVKFAALIAHADAHGLDGVATGHYAGTRDGLLLRGTDPARDQSYMLHRLTPAVLHRTVFPLHNMEKPVVRERAAAFGLPIPPDSQDICFIPNGGYAAYLGIPPKEGELVDAAGNVLGRHEGVHFFTIGQKHGVNGRRLYVAAIDSISGRVTLTEEERLYRSGIFVRNVNWITPPHEADCEVRLRHTPRLAAAHVAPLEGNRAHIIFKEPQRAPAPGQSAVFYDAEVVLGGGFIE
jgi:tRNA-specific 2-thiouridylase